MRLNKLQTLKFQQIYVKIGPEKPEKSQKTWKLLKYYTPDELNFYLVQVIMINFKLKMKLIAKIHLKFLIHQYKKSFNLQNTISYLLETYFSFSFYSQLFNDELLKN